MLKTTVTAAVLSLTLALPAQAISLSSLTGGDGDSTKASLPSLDAVSGLSALSGLSSLGDLSSLSSNPLVSSLTGSTDTSTAQSAAGSSLLLALAGSSLPSEQTSELASLVPGYSQLTDLVPGASSLKTMKSVMDTASALGIDASTLTQYIPKILEFVSGQGASAGLISGLTSLWATK